MERSLAKKQPTNPTTDPLLPTVHQPGTFEWAEEIVECINGAWRERTQGEARFLAAIRAALAHRIWVTLSPAPPNEPYTSLANLIRRTADAGQAAEMQIVVKYSGLEEQAERALAAGGTAREDVSIPWSDDPAMADDPELEW